MTQYDIPLTQYETIFSKCMTISQHNVNVIQGKYEAHKTQKF